MKGALDGRTTSHAGHEGSRRKLVEAVFGGLKRAGLFRRPRHHGPEGIGGRFGFTVAAYDLRRM